MNKEQLREKIAQQRDIKSHLWNAFLLGLAGTLGLSFSLDSLYKVILVITGSIIELNLIRAYFIKDIQIDNLIKKLEDK
ncbi:MAG: hypothetical protein PHV68_09500 [Candidatus Gastranaerophilales bacterium]|nr:hypothetical protein [Candidatus Gastranaerophilales bacterium]